MEIQMDDMAGTIVVAIGNVYEFNERHNNLLTIAELAARRRAKENFAVSAEMALMWGGDAKRRVVLLPKMPDPAFVSSVEELLHVRIEPLAPRLETGWVCRDLLADPGTFTTLISLLRGADVRMVPWGATQYYGDLVTRLRHAGIRIVDTSAPSDRDYWTVDYLDSKTGARSVMTRLSNASIPLSIPDGFVCPTRELAASVAAKMAKAWKHSVILKSDQGAGGRGVRLFLPGQRGERVASDYLSAMQDSDLWLGSPIIVEEAIGCGLDLSTPTFDGSIDADGIVNFRGVGSMLMSEHQYYVGVEMGRDTLAPDLESELKHIGMELGRAIESFGYAGWFDIDFLVPTNSAHTYGSEINARRTGPSQLIEIATQLHGPEWYLHKFYKMFERYWLDASVGDYGALETAIQHYNDRISRSGAGVIPVLTSSMSLARPYIGYVIFAEDRQAAYQFEREFQALLSNTRRHLSTILPTTGSKVTVGKSHRPAKNYRAALWDVDDVLIDTTGTYRAFRGDILSSLGLDSNIISHAISVWDRLFWFYDQGDVSGILQALFAELDIALPDRSAMKRAEFAYESTWLEYISPISGTAELLAELQQSGVLLGVVSTGNLEFQHLKLKRVGLLRYFDERTIVVAAPGSPLAKPRPEGLLAACNTLHVAPEEAIFVGDRQTDIVAANLAGTQSILFSDTQRAPEFKRPPREGVLRIEMPTYIAESVEDLRNLLVVGDVQ